MNMSQITGKYVMIHKILLFLLIMLVYLSYDFTYVLAYSMFPQHILDKMEYAFMDTVLCTFLVILWGMIYFKYLRQSEGKPVIQMNCELVFETVTLGFGVGGFAYVWFIFIEWLTQHSQLFPQTVEEFDNIWDYTYQESFIWVFLSIGIIGPIVEELIFRGVIFQLLSKISRPWLPIILSSIAFGIWHQQPVQIGYTLVAGFIFAMLRAYSGSIYLPIIAHILNNLLSTLPDSWYQYLDLPIIYLSLLAMIITPKILYKYTKSLKVNPYKVNYSQEYYKNNMN